MAKVVLVTGGTRGIGSGVSRLLAAQEWTVIAATVNPDEIAAFDAPENVTTAIVDVTDQGSVDALLAGLPRLDALVNCAGTLVRGREYDMAVFQKVIEVNLVGTMRCCVAAQPKLAESGGSIVNIASMLTFFGGPLVPAYSASKGGVGQLTKALASRWAQDGIRVNAVAPGWIDTEMTGALQRDEVRNASLMSRTPLNRWGKPEEVGALISWLLSDAASFVTGAIYPVDGGYSAV